MRSKILIIVVCACVWKADALWANLSSREITADSIFLDIYINVADGGGAIHRILNLGNDGSRVKRNEISEQIKLLPINEKCRYALLYLIAFDVDGEGGWQLGNDLGGDKKEVGRRLSQISDEKFKEACRNLKVSENRVTMFRTLTHRWKNEK